MKRIGPVLVLLLAGLPACDININDDGGGGGTESSDTSPTSGAEDGGEAGGEDGGGEDGGEAGDGTNPTGAGTGPDPTGAPETTGAAETGGVAETGGETGGFEDACNDEPDCNSCYQCSILPGNSCNAAAEACGSDNGCSALIDCQASCAGTAATQEEYDACFGTCAVDLPEGLPLLNELLNCRETTCTNACFGGGSTCDLQGECQACGDCVGGVGGPCEPYVDACAQNFDCVDLLGCQQTCLETSGSQGQLNACLVDCEATFPGGIAPLLDLDACGRGLCPVSCAG